MLRRVGIHDAQQSEIASAPQQGGKIRRRQVFAPALPEQTGGRMALAGRALKNFKERAKARVLFAETDRDEAHHRRCIEAEKLA